MVWFSAGCDGKSRGAWVFLLLDGMGYAPTLVAARDVLDFEFGLLSEQLVTTITCVMTVSSRKPSAEWIFLEHIKKCI